uniref:F-box domain-containing protein n=1 Tax=Kalanchoe fedtschenkoi TaxID=63787 RepID=A0A7N0URB1_KALFE
MAKRRKQGILDLPSDTLLLIVAQLDRKDVESVSLVSKHFLSLTNQLVRKLTFLKLPLRNSTLQKLLTRFSSVNEIDLDCRRVPRVLSAVLSSQLNVECLHIRGSPGHECPSQNEQHQTLRLCGSLKKLKTLSLGCCFCRVGEERFAQLIHPFPSLEELNLSDCAYPSVEDEWIARHDYKKMMRFNGCARWSSSDDQIRKLTATIPNLRKMEISFYCERPTDLSLDSLSANCVNLEEISFLGLTKFTPPGLCTFLHRLRNLRSIDLPGYWSPGSEFHPLGSEFHPLVEVISASENLSHLSLETDMIQDNILCAIAKSSPPLPLTSLSMENPTLCLHGYTMTGVSAMLSAFQRFTRLSIKLPGAPDEDMIMSQLVKSLVCLKGFSVASQCPIYATLFSLIDNCPVLESIWLHASRDVPPNYTTVKKNFSIKRISLHPAPHTLLKMGLKSVCPSVKFE